LAIGSIDRIGKLSEQLDYSQLLHSEWAKDQSIKLSSFISRAQVEVDFLAKYQQDLFGIEVKTNDQVMSRDLEGLRFFDKEV
jgi:hypothetical protein